MSEQDALQMILNHLHATPHHVITQAERADWPEAGFHSCLAAKLIQVAQPATTVFCDGCEQHCLMPVMMRPAINDRPARVMVQCDKPEEMGLVAIDIPALHQWQISLKILAESIGDILNVNRQLIRFDAEKKRWHLGIFKGKKHARPLFLVAQEEGLALQLAGHSIYLADVLTIDNNHLAIDQQYLTRKVDKACGTDETPEQRAIRIEKRMTELKGQGVRAFVKTVAEEEGVSVSRIKEIRSRGTQKNPKKKMKSREDSLPKSLTWKNDDW
ncbi:MAG: hypothetical protein GY821_03695 [Gammaproteobacteria bacterium]|nr:hypothetical protein [Gammaproteobacteria bacterium]